MPRISGTRAIAWIVIVVLALLILVTLAYVLLPKPEEPLSVVASLFW